MFPKWGADGIFMFNGWGFASEKSDSRVTPYRITSSDPVSLEEEVHLVEENRQ